MRADENTSKIRLKILQDLLTENLRYMNFRLRKSLLRFQGKPSPDEAILPRVGDAALLLQERRHRHHLVWPLRPGLRRPLARPMRRGRQPETRGHADTPPADVEVHARRRRSGKLS